MRHLPPDKAVTEAIDAATEAVVELQDALTAAGVVLPSLGIDLVACTRPVAPHPLVELGSCNLATARALTAALRRAAR